MRAYDTTQLRLSACLRINRVAKISGKSPVSSRAPLLMACHEVRHSISGRQCACYRPAAGADAVPTTVLSQISIHKSQTSAPDIRGSNTACSPVAAPSQPRIIGMYGGRDVCLLSAR